MGRQLSHRVGGNFPFFSKKGLLTHTGMCRELQTHPSLHGGWRGGGILPQVHSSIEGDKGSLSNGGGGNLALAGSGLHTCASWGERGFSSDTPTHEVCWKCWEIPFVLSNVELYDLEAWCLCGHLDLSLLKGGFPLSGMLLQVGSCSNVQRWTCYIGECLIFSQKQLSSTLDYQDSFSLTAQPTIACLWKVLEVADSSCHSFWNLWLRIILTGHLIAMNISL